MVKFNKLNQPVHISVFTDASHANLPDKVSSTSGMVVFLADNSGNMSPVTWRSNKIRRVVRSTLAAECLALQEGIEEALYVRHMLCEILNLQESSVQVHAYIDSRSLLEALRSTKLVDDRRLRIDIGAIKQSVERELSSISWISGRDMLANSLTKRGAESASLLAVFHSGRHAHV